MILNVGPAIWHGLLVFSDHRRSGFDEPGLLQYQVSHKITAGELFLGLSGLVHVECSEVCNAIGSKDEIARPKQMWFLKVVSRYGGR